jgi:hypothetical protein
MPEAGAPEGGAAPIPKAGTESAVDGAFATLVQLHASALGGRDYRWPDTSAEFDDVISVGLLPQQLRG